MKFSITDFFSKCDQISRFLRIRAHVLKKFVMENFIFCARINWCFSFVTGNISPVVSATICSWVLSSLSPLWFWIGLNSFFFRYNCKIFWSQKEMFHIGHKFSENDVIQCWEMSFFFFSLHFFLYKQLGSGLSP